MDEKPYDLYGSKFTGLAASSEILRTCRDQHYDQMRVLDILFAVALGEGFITGMFE